LSSAGAAAVEEAVFLDQLERIALPVLAPRVHHIDVCKQQHALLGRVLRADARNDVAVVRLALGDHDLHIVGTEAGGLEPRLSRTHDLRAGAGRLRGIDLDHLLVNLAKGCAAGIVGGAGRRKQRQGK
jgi:hypothetical protein